MSLAQSIAKTGKNNPNWKDAKIITKCSECGLELVLYKSKIRNKNFCSKKCKGKHIQIRISKELLIKEHVDKQQRLIDLEEIFNCGRETIRKLLIKYNIKRPKITNYKKGKEHSNWSGGLPKCIDCGKTVSHYSVKRCMNCSNKGEQNPMFGSKRIGKLSPNYKHGFSKEPYPIEFKQIREVIKQRDSYTCQCCGMTQEEHKEKFNQSLHVHHIDYNKFNNENVNLITTCANCNLKANGNRDYWFAFYTYIMENKINGILKCH